MSHNGNGQTKRTPKNGPRDAGSFSVDGEVAALRTSEIRYRRLFEAAKDGVLLVDPATRRITDANPFMMQMLGYRHEEFVGKELFEIGLFRDEGAAQDTFRRLHDQHEVRYEHLPLKGKDGAAHYVEVVANLYDEDGRPTIQCNVRDITERHRSEEVRRAGEARYRSLFDAIDEGFCIVEMLFDDAGRPVDYRFEAVNASFARQSGLHDAVGKRIRELVPQHEAHWFDIYGRVARTGEPVRFTNEARGLNRWFDVYCFAVDGDNHRSVGVLFTDITERKRLETALRTSEIYFRELTHNLPIGVWTSGADGCVDFINNHWLIYTGLKLARGMTHADAWSHIVHPDDYERAAAICADALAAGKPYEFEARFQDACRGGFRWFLKRSIPVYDARGMLRKRIGICIDIDELKRGRDLLAAHAGELEAQVQARTSELRETIGELEAFSYSVSHDMRAPLRAMQGYGHILLQELAGKLDPGSIELLRQITVAAARLDTLIRDVLAYSGLLHSEIPLQSVDLAEVVHRVIATYPQLHAKGVELTIGALGTVTANDASLTQVLSNLLTNAVKFVAPGVQPQVLVYAEVLDGHVRVWVEDNGIGIEPKDHERIWGLFTRIGRARDYEGTGIGLAIARKAVERMHGTIGLESTPGSGSRFWFRLPRG